MSLQAVFGGLHPPYLYSATVSQRAAPGGLHPSYTAEPSIPVSEDAAARADAGRVKPAETCSTTARGGGLHPLSGHVPQTG